MQRILITGGTGALGQALIQQLKALNQSEIFLTSTQKHLFTKDEMTIRCDFNEIEQLTHAFNVANPDIIFHLGAAFTFDLNEAYRLNVLPAKHLLELISAQKKAIRLVLVGSAAEYGYINEEDNPVTENHVLSPISPYGLSKAWQTQLMCMYSNYNVDVVCARIFNLYGPGLSEKLFAGRLQKQIDEIKFGIKTSIEVGSLNAIRDYVTTEEAARQLIAIARHGNSGNIYHVASGIPIKIQDFLNDQLKLNDIDSSVVRTSELYSNRKGPDIPIIFACIKKTQALINKH